jgi:hypothetical protein
MSSDQCHVEFHEIWFHYHPASLTFGKNHCAGDYGWNDGRTDGWMDRCRNRQDMTGQDGIG